MKNQKSKYGTFIAIITGNLINICQLNICFKIMSLKTEYRIFSLIWWSITVFQMYTPIARIQKGHLNYYCLLYDDYE